MILRVTSQTREALHLDDFHLRVMVVSLSCDLILSL